MKSKQNHFLKKALAALCLSIPLAFTTHAQYEIPSNGVFSEELLERYLDRAITMADLANLTLSQQEVNEDIALIEDVRPRFIGRVAHIWGGESRINNGYFANVGNIVQQIKNVTPQNEEHPIIQAAIFEHVSWQLSTVAIPNYVYDAYPWTGGGTRPTHFNKSRVTYSSSSPTPDITKPEAQRWFYYMATQYLDQGIEALHLGYYASMSQNAGSAQAWSTLINKIRDYAQVNSPRHFVLCDAHTNGVLVPGTNELIFDFHTGPLPIINKNIPWSNNATTKNGGHAVIDPDYAIGNCYGQHIMSHGSLGGKSRFGWTTYSLPYLVEFDHTNSTYGPNQFNGAPNCSPWGWDMATWFAVQDSYDGLRDGQESYSNDWLKYAYYKVKCIDPKAHLQVLGRRTVNTGFHPHNGGSETYRAATNITGTYSFSNGGQQETIKRLWNGEFANENWTAHLFNQNEVAPPSPNNVTGNIVQVGENRIYYVANDGRVHGYVKINGQWKNSSPSWASHSHGGNQTISNQSKVAPADNKTALVANPSGTHLYYIGEDGNVHGFALSSTNLYDATYFKLPAASGVKAAGSLICPTDGRLYYIGYETGSQKRRVHGFVQTTGSTWSTMSPTWSSHGNGNHINTQVEVETSLVCDPSVSNLYYIGKDGNVHNYKINNVWNYNYAKMNVPMNTKAINSLICPTDNRLYYVLQNNTSGKSSIHAFIRHTSNGQLIWGSTSVTGMATHSNTWTGHPLSNAGTPLHFHFQPVDNLTINASGDQIFYRGTDALIHNYNIISDWLYSYTTEYYHGPNALVSNDISMNSDDEIFYVSWGSSKEINVLRKGSPCGNEMIPAIDAYTKSFGMANNGSSSYSVDSQLTDDEVTLYPNPATSTITVRGIEGLQEVEIFNAMGKKVKSVSTETIDVSSLKNGVYILRIHSNDQTISKRFLKR